MGERINIGQLYRKKLLLNHTASDGSQNRKQPVNSVSSVSEIADAISLSTARTQADRILRDAVKEARKLLRNARRKADSLEESGRRRANGFKVKARKDGYEEGFRTGKREGLEALTKEVASMEALVHSIDSQLPSLNADFSKDLTDLVLTIARKVTGTICENDSAVLTRNISRLLSESFKDGDELTIRLSPADYDLVADSLSKTQLSGNFHTVFQCDTSFEPGECRIVSPLKAVLISFRKRFEAVEEELSRLIIEEYHS